MKVLDGTVGAGGHSAEILKIIGPTGLLIANDRDSDTLQVAKLHLADHPNILWFQKAFSELPDILRSGTHGGMPLLPMDAILLDLGISSFHVDDAERGFSFQQDGPLDMRMDRMRQTVTAAEVVNTYTVHDLTKIFRDYGEESRAYHIALAIEKQRQHKIFTTTLELSLLIQTIKKPNFKTHTNPATKVFQALRLYVNDELGELSRMLANLPGILAPGTRVAIITFHSLEDRLVKHYFQREAQDCICKPKMPICLCGHSAQFRIITKKPLLPSEKEISSNPRSRSAKLRVAERIYRKKYRK